ncbi:MAG: hypothetical protein M0Q51_14120 [Bacteroidales bacterium]|nr:hypothetical protein [Bacteroidales bacterium]
MKFIQGHDRTQTHLFPVSLDQSIDSDHEVRLITPAICSNFSFTGI